MEKHKTELVAPAGSFSAAVYAFTNGADAVYAGLPAFSARKHAQNLTLDELSKLKQYAAEKRKKIYITLNTVILEEETGEICSLLVDLAFLKVDAVIIQDPGLLLILKKYFPGLPVHASTQMAVHNAAGAEYLQQAGVKRVVLSRELSFSQVKAIRDAVPGMELEVFVHGALCYGFSGLCLASGLLLGRSGNRGDCAQVCRSWFTCRNTRGYFFSCNDLALKEKIRSLRDIGIAALKIEGRMKSPEYAGLTSGYYSSLLADGAAGEQAACLEKIRLSFSRNQTTGFFPGPTGQQLVNTEYPSHTGVFAGTVKAAEKNGLLLQLEQPVTVHEGLLFFTGKNPVQPVQFGIKKITRQQKIVFAACAGEQIRVESGKPFPALPAPGAQVYKISSQELKWPELKPGAFPARKHPVKGKVVLSNTAISFTTAPGEITGMDGAAAAPCECVMELTPLAAEGSKNFQVVLAELSARSGSSCFEITALDFINQSALPAAKIFIRPSLLKQFKNRVYNALQLCYNRQQADLVRQITDYGQGNAAGMHPAGETAAGVFPRSLVRYGHPGLPFVQDPGELESITLPVCRERPVIALHPVTDDPGRCFSALTAYLERHKEQAFLIGLNNITHFAWLEKLYAYPGVSFFIDYCLYCANSFAYRYYTERVQRLEFILYWIEAQAADFENWTVKTKNRSVPVLKADENFKPHLFLSKVCFRQQSLGKDCRNCPRQEEYRLEQNRKLYRVVVKDCLTYVFQA